MPSYEDILNGGLQDENADSYAEMLGSEAGNTSPSQDPPFYITAYGLAVRAGFRGTLAEWLISLIGPKGDNAELRYDVESQALQWKQSDESEWKTLLTLADLQGDVVAQTLAAAEEATKHAPRISAVNRWEIWNAQLGVYEDTGVEAMAGAETAQEAAREAAGHAGDAENAKAAAQEAKEDASRAASAAEGAKEEAEQAKENAETSAGDAAAAAGRASGFAEAAAQAAVRQPILSDNNTWMIWDAALGTYKDTGVMAIGKDGKNGGAGQRGASILRVTTAPKMQYTADSSYFGFLLENVISESGAAEVLVGDLILYEDTLCRVSGIVDSILLIGSMDSIGGTDGQRGTGILRVTTAPTTHRYSEGVMSYRFFGFKYSDVLDESGATEVLKGDVILHQGVLYPVWYINEYYGSPYGASVGGGIQLRGEKGDDGITPHIGTNGNWWVGDLDTGVPAAGIVSDVKVAMSANASGDSVLQITVSYAKGISSVYRFPVERAMNADTYHDLVKVLYAGADGYLYRVNDFSDTANRLTLQELKDIIVRSVPLTIEFWSGKAFYRMSVNVMSADESYGWVGVSYAAAGSTVFLNKVFYTAEHAPAVLYAYYVDRYLYRTNDFGSADNRLTLTELEEVFRRNGKVNLWVQKGEILACWPSVKILFFEENGKKYGLAQINDDENDGDGVTPFYTAEYEAEELIE